MPPKYHHPPTAAAVPTAIAYLAVNPPSPHELDAMMYERRTRRGGRPARGGGAGRGRGRGRGGRGGSALHAAAAELPLPVVVGLHAVRGGEIIEVRDEDGTLMNDFSGRVRLDERKPPRGELWVDVGGGGRGLSTLMLLVRTLAPALALASCAFPDLTGSTSGCT